VSRRFEVSLSAQGYNRFVFDYENTHDMMGPIWLAGAHFTGGGIKVPQQYQPVLVPMLPNVFRHCTDR
jgi:hypothetical protein